MMDQSAGVERRWGAKTANERRQARRAALMGAAIATYGAVGYRNATVKSVCAVAGLTERYFYESFASSEDLLQACFLEVTGQLLLRMRAAAKDTTWPVLDRIRAGLLVYFADLQARPAEARVFLMEMHGISAATEATLSASLDVFGALLMDVIQDERGVVVAPPPLLLRGVVGGGLHIAQAWIASDYATSIEDVTEAALKIYRVVVDFPRVAS